jgi:hypothetical protein
VSQPNDPPASEPSAAAQPYSAFDPESAPGSPNGVPGSPWYADQPAPAPRRPVLTAVQAIGVLIAASALGWPLGVLWQAVAPNVPVLVVADGAIYNDSQPEQFMGGDGWFVLLGLAFGILVAFVTWLTCRQLRGPLGLLVLAVGGTVAAVAAWKFGREIGLSDYLAGLHTAPEGTHLSKPNDVRIESFQWWPPKLAGVLLIPALSAVLTMTIMAAWSGFSNLRGGTLPASAVTQPPEAEPFS